MKRNSSKPKRKTAGFTLVELVVVIAVLAILAGVGVVAYNGYITYAQKGKDRQTVGEIMHALELADYADPTLFGETGSATIVISSTGTDAAGGSDSEKLKAALEDAFGEGGLESIKLNYDGWDSSGFNASILSSLIENENLKKLGEAIQSTGSKSSYAGNVEELWDTVGKLVEAQAYRGNNLMEKALNYVDTYGEQMMTAWTGGTELSQSGTDGAYLAASVARNYAFANFARNHQNFNEDMEKQLQQFLEEKGGNNGINYTSPLARDILEGDGWDEIVNDYIAKNGDNHSQAEVDALSFVTVMDAAKAVAGSGDIPEDNVFLEVLEPYLGVLDTALTDTNNLKSQAEMIGKISDKNVIVITAQKNNGIWNWGPNNVYPLEANPRASENSIAGGTPDEGCKENHTTSFAINNPNVESTRVSIQYTDGSVTGKIADKQNATIYLCTKDGEHGSLAITNNASATFHSNNEGIVKFEGDTMIAVASGNTTFTVTVSDQSFTFNVVVH